MVRYRIISHTVTVTVTLPGGWVRRGGLPVPAACPAAAVAQAAGSDCQAVWPQQPKPYYVSCACQAEHRRLRPSPSLRVSGGPAGGPCSFQITALNILVYQNGQVNFIMYSKYLSSVPSHLQSCVLNAVVAGCAEHAQKLNCIDIILCV